MDALADITVVDFTSHIAAPYATKLLADLGARVIKIERPGGDPSRELPPFKSDDPGSERSATFHFLNTNKESVVLDLKHDRRDEVLAPLLQQADLIVESFPPAVAERLGLTYPEIARIGRAPVVSVTNFGRTGPYRDYRLSDTVLFAMGGEMFSHGLAAREPLKMGGTAALIQCGAMAAVAALGAVHAYELHGVGQHVEVPLFDVQANNVDRRSSAILAYRFSGRIQGRPAGPSPGLAGGVYPVADGHVEVTASAGEHWARFVDMIDDERLRGPRWADPAFAMTPAARETVDAVVYPWMLSHTRQEVWAAARRARAMVAPLFTAVDVFSDPVYNERGLWTEIEHTVLGRMPMLGRPYTLEKTPWRLRTPAPLLGQHTSAVLAEAGLPGERIVSLLGEGVVA